MNVLVFNCGSSSLKYSLLRMPGEEQIARGEAQRVGPKTAEPARIIHRRRDTDETVFVEMPDHQAAFDAVMQVLERDGVPLPDVVGHRIVHGGRLFHGESVIFDDQVDEGLDEVSGLAPIHNPPAIALVRACRKRHRDLRQVLVFDTSFHGTIPPRAATYALPEDLRERHGIRKYGFHGISHQFVTGEAARLLDKPREQVNLVSCHLGSGGASLCAVVKGRSIDNTMGFSPLQGLIMSTRCGDLDPAITLQLLARRDGDHEAVESLLNKRSGVLGLSERSADIRDIAASVEQGEGLNIPTETYLWRIRKYLGAYLTAAAPVDAIVFTDTIGETMPFVRWALCSGLRAFGVELDSELNTAAECVADLPADVATRDSGVRILAIATNEELAIARVAHETATHDEGVLH